MKVWSHIKDGKERGPVLIELEDREEMKHFLKYLSDFVAANPRRRKAVEWLKNLRKNLPY